MFDFPPYSWVPKSIVFEHPQAIAAIIRGPHRHNRLYICTGIVIAEWGTTSEDDWIRDDFSVELPDREMGTAFEDRGPCMVFWPGEVFDDRIAAAMWVSSWSADENDMGCAVDHVSARWDPKTGRIRVDTKIARKGDKMRLNSFGYNVSFLARIYKDKGPDGCVREMK
jgi:hypothetical protein